MKGNRRMTFKFIYTPDTLIQETIAKANYKRENSIVVRLANEADKLFGQNNWEQVPNYDVSLDNIIGWYARRKNGDDTIEVKPVS
jgi:hypothetical protein